MPSSFGIGTGIRRLVDPLTLGLDGLWNCSNTSSLFQNSDGTGAVVATNPVGRIADLSGNGRHWTQATAGSRGTYQTGGYVLFDGIDDFMTGPLVTSVMTASAYGVVIAARIASSGSDSASGFSNPALMADVGAAFISVGFARSSGLIGGYNWDGNADNATTPLTFAQDFVFVQQHTGGQLTVQRDLNAAVSLASGNTTNTTGTLSLMRGNTGGSGRLSGRFYGAAIRKTPFTETEIGQLVRWFAEHQGRYFK